MKGYATAQCKKFVRHSDRLRKMLGENPTGWQAKYSERNSARACTIGCKADKGASIYGQLVFIQTIRWYGLDG